MAAAASARLARDPAVTIRWCGFEEFASAARCGGTDLITMVAVLHHLDLGNTTRPARRRRARWLVSNDHIRPRQC